VSRRQLSQNPEDDANNNNPVSVPLPNSDKPVKPVNGSTSHSGLPDPSRFRIPQNYAEHIQTRKKAVNVPLGKPDDQLWIWIPSSNEWRSSVGMLRDKKNREWYVVEPELLPEISETLIPVLVVMYVTRGGSPGLWPIRMPNETGRIDSFNGSALEIACIHTDKWIRVILNADGRGYEFLEMDSAVEMPQPKLPADGYWHLFGLAVKGNTISSLQHPLLKHLRGEQQL
jgi:hypothetical protein